MPQLGSVRGCDAGNHSLISLLLTGQLPQMLKGCTAGLQLR